MSGKIRKPVVEQPESVDALSPGDTINVGLSGEINTRKGQKMWPRFGVDSKVREGETGEEALERVSDFVVDNFNEFVNSLR